MSEEVKVLTDEELVVFKNKGGNQPWQHCKYR